MLHMAYGHLGGKHCGRIFGEDAENKEEVTCDDCKDVMNGTISKEVEKRVVKNLRLFR